MYIYLCRRYIVQKGVALIIESYRMSLECHDSWRHFLTSFWSKKTSKCHLMGFNGIGNFASFRRDFYGKSPWNCHGIWRHFPQKTPMGINDGILLWGETLFLWPPTKLQMTCKDHKNHEFYPRNFLTEYKLPCPIFSTLLDIVIILMGRGWVGRGVGKWSGIEKILECRPTPHSDPRHPWPVDPWLWRTFHASEPHPNVWRICTFSRILPRWTRRGRRRESFHNPENILFGKKELSTDAWHVWI